MTQTKNTTKPGLDPKLAALIPSGSEVYDAIMGKIEPELVSGNLPLLAEKYRDEPEKERLARMQRYKAAFTKYDEVYDRWLSKMRTAVKAKRLDAFKKAEVKVKQQDETALQDLEAQFSVTAA